MCIRWGKKGWGRKNAPKTKKRVASLRFFCFTCPVAHGHQMSAGAGGVLGGVDVLRGLVCRVRGPVS
jgi:hypothetical protein